MAEKYGEIPPRFTRAWWNYFWYYYKWRVVITAEPGIYLPGRFGVRIEDMLWLRDGGAEDLTKAPRELIIL